jgi:hypothetical protein
VSAADGIEVTVEDDAAATISFAGHSDWLGPARFLARGTPRRLDSDVDVAASVRADDAIGAIVFRLEARHALARIQTGSFAEPSYAWPVFDPSARAPGGLPDRARGFGFQYTEFAWPAQSDASLARWRLLPFRPPVVEPLGVVVPDGRCLLLAPLDAFHDQIIGVDDGIACGWHGDLERVPARFATEIVVLAGPSVRACLDRYGAIVQARAGTVRPLRDADDLGRSLSYWTDNGASYWYRTEPGHDTPSTLRAVIDDLRTRRIPVHAVQLDSWWYAHEVVRPFDTDDWVVPPTGLVRWEARDDVLPDGIGALRNALGDPPLVTHCRHLSSASPYLDELECWVDGDRAHPITSDLYERWLDQAQAWGVRTFEHDWLVESFLGVRGLRAGPGRAREWQEGIDRAAAARGITLQWCMATPADLLQTSTLGSVTSVRTSGDHGYLLGPGELWAWFLLNNVLARALGLRPYKDVFLSDASVPEHHSEVEALLAALSTGPVGIGDAVGRADRDIVLRTCREDGVLVRPDVPLAAIDRCFPEHPVARDVPLVAEAWTDHVVGRYAYVVALNVSKSEQRLDTRIELASLGESQPTGPVACWDWRGQVSSRLEPDDSWPVALGHLDWDLRVLAPILDCGLAVIGDPNRYATAGDRRITNLRARTDGVRFTVLGAGEDAVIVGWAEEEPSGARSWTASRGWSALDVHWTAPTWRLQVAVADAGWTTIEVTAVGV